MRIWKIFLISLLILEARAIASSSECSDLFVDQPARSSARPGIPVDILLDLATLPDGPILNEKIFKIRQLLFDISYDDSIETPSETLRTLVDSWSRISKFTRPQLFLVSHRIRRTFGEYLGLWEIRTGRTYSTEETLNNVLKNMSLDGSNNSVSKSEHETEIRAILNLGHELSNLRYGAVSSPATWRLRQAAYRQWWLDTRASRKNPLEWTSPP